MALCSVPAHAGTWLLQITSGSGTATAPHKPTQTWTAPAVTPPPPPATPPAPPPPTNSVSIPSLSNGQSATAGGGTATASANLTATITGTWQADPTLPSDPPPPKVLVCESSSAYANDTSSDANGNPTPAVPGSTINDGLGDSIDPSAQPVGTAHGIKYVPESGGTFTVTLTLQSSAPAKAGPSGTSPNGLGFLGSGICSAGVGPVTVSIHAQPYNFRRVPGQGRIGIDGNIDWVYDYSSTDGNPNDLTTCAWHEHLTYPGGQVGTQAAPNKYYPPSPPFGYPASGTGWLPNPDFGTDVSLVPSPAGSAPEIDDITFVPAFLKPYTYGTYSTTQVFEFNDSATGDKNVQIPGPDSGPFTIVRTVQYLDATDYQYTVSKASVTDTLTLPD